MSKFGLELSYLFEHRIPGAKDIDERFSMHITAPNIRDRERAAFSVLQQMLCSCIRRAEDVRTPICDKGLHQWLLWTRRIARPNHHDGWEWQVPEVPSSEFLVRQMPPVLLYPMTKIDPSLAERVEVLRSVQNLESTGAQNNIARGKSVLHRHSLARANLELLGLCHQWGVCPNVQ